jgi:AraC-like DNA-binding protein
MSDFAESNLNLHSTLVSIAAVIVDALQSYGLAFQPILEEAGLDPNKIYDPSERIPSINAKRLWELAVQYSCDPCFGLTYAAYIQPSALHGLGLSWIASHSLKDGLERLVRFQRILSTDRQLGLRETQTGYCIYAAVGQKDDPLHFPDAEFDSTVASIYKICQIMLGPDIKPIRVSVEHPAPPCKEKFEQFFRVPVSFDASETAIEFDKQISVLPASSANPELTRINDQIVIDYLNQFEQDDIVTKTRKYIIDHLPSGVPRQAIIASDLNMSLRNFQRKLSQSDTSYTDVLSQVRHEMACYYLKAPNHPVIEIAYLLGFADPSNFSRAFKRWNGQSPHHFRQAYLQQELT